MIRIFFHRYAAPWSGNTWKMHIWTQCVRVVSPIATAMLQPSFLTLVTSLGTGKWARQKHRIGSHVRSATMFLAFERWFEESIEQVTQELSNNIKAANSSHVIAVCAAFDVLRNESAAVEAELHPEFRNRLQQEVRAAQEVLQEIQSVIG